MPAVAKTLTPVTLGAHAAARAWQKFRDDPVVMRRLNGWLTVFWILAIPVSYAAGWLKSVVYVSALSLWALVAGHLSTWQAARVEVKQKQGEDDPVEDRVVDKLLAETNLENADDARRFW